MAGGSKRFDPVRLRSLRLAAGLTQRQLAQRAGVAPGRIGDWERGRFRPEPASLTRLAQALAVTPAALQTPTDSPTLADLRADTGLTQRQLAAAAGLTAGAYAYAYAYLELGATTLRPPAAAALAAALGVDADTVAAAHARTALRHPATR